MAITVTREKNIISVLIEGKKAPYKFDINTGIVYGLRGKAVKIIPKEAFYGICPVNNYNRSELEKVIYYGTHYGYATYLNELQRYTNALRLADSFDNLGISVYPNDYYGSNILTAYENLAKDKKLVREFIKYANEHIAKEENYSYRDFIEIVRETKAQNYYDFDITDRKYKNIYWTLVKLTEWATPREIKCFLVNYVYNNLYLVNSNKDEYISFGFENMFKVYCKYCKYLNEKVTVKENFFSEFARINKAYLAQKQQIDKERFNKAVDIHRAEMEFEYGDFKVVIPTCPQDIKDEGRNMHHCVASYAFCCMDTDNPNRSYIVFVRHKDTPDKCYITCEIQNGNIGQYFLSHDRYISTNEDKEFKRKYQEHLNKTWIKE